MKYDSECSSYDVRLDSMLQNKRLIKGQVGVGV